MKTWYQYGLLLPIATGLGCGITKPESDDDDDDGRTPTVPADILFVVDNSGSTASYSAALLQHVPVLINTMQSGDQPVDFRMALTTTTVWVNDGFTDQQDPGESGLFANAGAVVKSTDSDAISYFQQTLGCWASCWNGYDMPSDSTYPGAPGNCPFPEDGVATTQYVDCLCDDADFPADATWDSNELCGSGNEMPVEAALMAICQAVDIPPSSACAHVDSTFQDAWTGNNTGWLRADTPTHIVFMTDEGDSSVRSVGGLYGNSEVEADVYLDAFARFGTTITFSAIGPTLENCDADNRNCDTTCSNVMYPPSRTGAVRLKNLADATGGKYFGITVDGENGDGGESCPVSDFGPYMRKLARLFAGG